MSWLTGSLINSGIPKGLLTLAEDVVKERKSPQDKIDKTLENLEKKWFQDGFSLLSRNSSRTKSLKIDGFGGLFISSGVSLALAFSITIPCLLYAKMKKLLECMFMDMIRLGWMGYLALIYNTTCTSTTTATTSTAPSSSTCSCTPPPHATPL
ncbi:hypothetical protein Tco_0648078 [Tanacetum coccineum]